MLDYYRMQPCHGHGYGCWIKHDKGHPSVMYSRDSQIYSKPPLSKSRPPLPQPPQTPNTAIHTQDQGTKTLTTPTQTYNKEGKRHLTVHTETQRLEHMIT